MKINNGVYWYKCMILYSCIRTSENITGWPTEGKCTFLSIGIPCRPLQSWMKNSFKGIDPQHKKNCLGLSKVSFLSRKLPGESKERSAFYVQKISKIVCEFYFVTAITFHFLRTSKSPRLFNLLHGRPAQPLHLNACKVDDNEALHVVQRAQQVTCRPIVHL